MTWINLPPVFEADPNAAFGEPATLYRDYEKGVARITKFVMIQEILRESLPNPAQ